MSPEDFQRLLIALGAATAAFLARRDELVDVVALLNRLNEGNPHYTPYPVDSTGSSSAPPDSSTPRSRP
jgi:hypothetical protein